jgi:plastocyanin
MANHDIFIRLGKTNLDEPDKSTLELSDGGTSNIKSGDTVTWIIDDKEITSILVMDDNRHNNVFAPDPRPEKGSRNWTARAKEVKKLEVETYTICWAQNGQVFCYDPQIIVNP